MRLEISARHMEITDALKTHVESRLQKLKAHFDRVIDVNVVLGVEKHRHLAEITLHANGIRIHGREATGDMYGSVDAVVDKLEKQVRKYKDRINRYQPRKGKETAEYHHHILEYAGESGEGLEGDDARHRVIRREKLPMKPMNVEEASMQLELVDEPFLVFSNADTQQLNVIYSRNDGTFGLIEPQF